MSDFENPNHYALNGNLEVIDVIRLALTPEEFRGHCKGCALKYLFREKKKGGTQDLIKAKKYLEFLITAEALLEEK